ncbi:Outer membrane protein (porin) [Alteromonadaceae bacterium Bs31]|nr:Outer membrane protein (porin) [Alteromonadaceae bacterium Bs31]
MRINHTLLGRISMAMCLLVSSSTSLADINLNGFATIAGGLTMSDDQSVNGYDDSFSFDQNSLIGLQVNSDLGEGLSATAQIISRGAEEWDAKFEWAYLGYQATDNLKLLFGRQRTPFYLYSDYLDVSYAYHWITAPESAYAVPFDSTDGIGLILENQLGSVDSSLQIQYGRYSGELNAGSLDSKNQFIAAWSLSWNWLSFRLGYSQTDIILESSELDFLIAGWTQAGFPAFEPHISASDGSDTGDFLDVGLTIDHNNILFVAEYTQLSIDGTPFAETREAYYGSFGYRFGNVMPHITYVDMEETASDYSFLDAVPSGVSPALDQLSALTAGLFESSAEAHDYYIVGVRWDFHASAAFKAEYKSQTDNKGDGDTDNLLRFAVVTVF